MGSGQGEEEPQRLRSGGLPVHALETGQGGRSKHLPHCAFKYIPYLNHLKSFPEEGECKQLRSKPSRYKGHSNLHQSALSPEAWPRPPTPRAVRLPSSFSAVCQETVLRPSYPQTSPQHCRLLSQAHLPPTKQKYPTLPNHLHPREGSQSNVTIPSAAGGGVSFTVCRGALPSVSIWAL